MDWLKTLDLGRWWNVAMAVGAATTIAALAVKEIGFAATGLGMLSFGLGEWLNHRKEMVWIKGEILTSYPRFNRPAGIVLDVIGVLLLGFGIYRVVLFGHT
jgi:hypothetical protein